MATRKSHETAAARRNPQACLIRGHRTTIFLILLVIKCAAWNIQYDADGP